MGYVNTMLLSSVDNDNDRNKASYVFFSIERTGRQEVDFYFFSWIFSSFVSTCYTYVWDVKMDWGLMDPNHGFLRSKLLFKHLVRDNIDSSTERYLL